MVATKFYRGTAQIGGKWGCQFRHQAALIQVHASHHGGGCEHEAFNPFLHRDLAEL